MPQQPAQERLVLRRRPPPAAGLAPVPAASAPLTLQLAMEWTRSDITTLFIVSCVELCILLAGLAHGTIGGARGVGGSVAVLATNAAALALATWSPRSWAARWRLPIMTLARLANMVLWPLSIDLLSVLSGHVPLSAGSTAQAFEAAAVANAARKLLPRLAAVVASWVRGAAMLVIPVAGIHACLLVALHLQLPPLAHVAVQAISVAGLAHRAPAVCQQYVGIHPVHAKVAEAAHWLLRQVVGTLCLGTRAHLDDAAAPVSAVDKCAAVAWTLQASLGLMLATLLVWQQQVREARRLAVRKAQLSAAAAAEAEAELACSPYARICAPVLEAAGAFGTYAVPILGAVLASFIAAMIVQQQGGLDT